MNERINGIYEKYTGKDLQEFDYERRAQIQEDEFVRQYGGYNFFEGGDAEAQYVFRRLLADRWITL